MSHGDGGGLVEFVLEFLREILLGIEEAEPASEHKLPLPFWKFPLYFLGSKLLM